MAFKMKGKPYKMGTHKTKATMAYMKSPLEQAKPDYPDIDGDGNTKESMKQAAADKKSPMEQELGFMDKLKAVGQAFENYQGPFGSTSLYGEYKDDKAARRAEMRREELGLKQEQRRDHRGAPYFVTVNADGVETDEKGNVIEK
mgnify:CR=1 FL=1|tara:strand:+ start:105 stop:536 length:432 start_codon:yes stop_codon:yes gene_type:complete